MGFVAVLTQIGGYLLHKMGMLPAYLLVAMMAFLLAISAAYVATHEIIISWII